MKYKPYPAYKDSGVEWLGEVPEHWDILRVVDVATIINGAPFDSANFAPDGDYPLLRIRDLNKSSTETRYSGAFDQAVVVLKDDVLIGMDGDFNVGRWYGHEPALLNQRMCCIRTPSKALSAIFAHGLAFPLKAINDVTYSTTVKHLSSYQIAKTRLALPAIETEQTAIATFLDRETAKLDTLIAKQEKLVELLQEKRRALISHVVTKGLNPDAPMRDSGVEWLGEVPDHWEVKRLRFVGDAIIGLTYDPSEITDETEGILVLRSSNVQGGRITFEDNVYVSTAIPEKLITRVDDILICSRNGSRALIGKNAKIDFASAGVTFGAFMTIFRSDSNAFLFYVFNSMIFDYQAGSFMTSTVNQLTVGNLYGFEVPMPPTEEQSVIVEYLDVETAKLEVLIEKSRRSIELMREHRTALISAAVTGKIDVRAQHQAAA